MNYFNRLVVTAFAVLLVVGGAFCAGAAAGWLSSSDLGRVPLLLSLARAIRELPSGGMLWCTVGGGTAAVLGLLLLVLEIRTPTQDRDLLLSEDKTGQVTVSLAGMRRLANHVVSPIPGVERVTSDARPNRKGLAFRCRVVVDPDASVPELAEEIRGRLHSAVLTHLGQSAARIQIHTQVGSPQTNKRRVR